MWQRFVMVIWGVLSAVGWRMPARMFAKFSEKAPRHVADDHLRFLKKARWYVTSPEVHRAAWRARRAPKGEQRLLWENAANTQSSRPLKYFTPRSLRELSAIVANAEANNCRVRAIGSGHSFSDVAVTNDYMIDTHGLNRVLSVDPNLLKAGTDTTNLFEVEGGIRISDLNEELHRRDLALANMGGYDAQTIVGAASTSTHGSGITLGPISDSIVSMTLVASGGAIFRIEPDNGVTDPDRFVRQKPDIRLVQNSEWFHAAAVGLGSLGIVYSVLLDVLPKYFLREHRYLSTWNQVRNDLDRGDVLRQNRHYEVLVNPYKVGGHHTCLVTERNVCPPPDAEASYDVRHRRFLYELTGLFPRLDLLLAPILNAFPHIIPEFLDQSMRTLDDSIYVDRSYRVLNLGSANHISAYSSEIGFPVGGNVYLRAVERILASVERSRTLGGQYHTSPISLRFVKASGHFLSMQEGRDTCMIEVPMVSGTVGGREMLERLERDLAPLGGRPHWGQLHFLYGGLDAVQQLYPRLRDWLEVYRTLNPSGTFDNAFTGRCGFPSASPSRS